MTFEEVGRNLSAPQLEKMKEKTFDYLGKVIRAMEDFIEEERFKTT